MKRYARKIACAIFYREKKRCAPPHFQAIGTWGQLINRAYLKSIERFLEMPNVEIGTRKNVQFGNQFSYRHLSANEPDVFGMIAQFGSGMVIACMIVDPFTADRMLREGRALGIPDEPEPWVAVGENYR